MLVPFDDEPPDVKPGDRVLCRTAFDEWVEMTALSEPRYDKANSLGGRCYLTVRVRGDTAWPNGVNWPAEDVRLIGGER